MSKHYSMSEPPAHKSQFPYAPVILQSTHTVHNTPCPDAQRLWVILYHNLGATWKKYFSSFAIYHTERLHLYREGGTGPSWYLPVREGGASRRSSVVRRSYEREKGGGRSCNCAGKSIPVAHASGPFIPREQFRSKKRSDIYSVINYCLNIIVCQSPPPTSRNFHMLQ